MCFVAGHGGGKKVNGGRARPVHTYCTVPTVPTVPTYTVILAEKVLIKHLLPPVLSYLFIAHNLGSNSGNSLLKLPSIFQFFHFFPQYLIPPPSPRIVVLCRKWISLTSESSFCIFLSCKGRVCVDDGELVILRWITIHQSLGMVIKTDGRRLIKAICTTTA